MQNWDVAQLLMLKSEEKGNIGNIIGDTFVSYLVTRLMTCDRDS